MEVDTASTSAVPDDEPYHDDMPSYDNEPCHDDMPSYDNEPCHDDKPCHDGKPCHDDKPFPFLRLPKDLRLMVYDCLPIVTRHHTHLKQCPTDMRRTDSNMIIVTKTVPGVSILATCRLINSEASRIIAKKLEDVRSQPTKYIIDADTILDFFCCRFGVPRLVTDIISGDRSRWDQTNGLRWNVELDTYGEERDPYSGDWTFTARPFVKFVEKCVDWELKGRPASRDLDAKVEIAIKIGGVFELLTSYQSELLPMTMSELPRYLRNLRECLSGVCPRRTVQAMIKFSGPTLRPWEQDLVFRAESGSIPETHLTVLSEDAWKDDWAEGAESL